MIRLQIVLCRYHKNFHFCDILITFIIPNQSKLILLQIDTNLRNFTSINIIKIDEKSITIDSELIIITERVKRNKTAEFGLTLL